MMNKKEKGSMPENNNPPKTKKFNFFEYIKEIRKRNDISATEKIILEELALRFGNDGKIFPSNKTIEESTAIKEKTIRTLLSKLKKDGFIGYRGKKTKSVRKIKLYAPDTAGKKRVLLVTEAVFLRQKKYDLIIQYLKCYQDIINGNHNLLSIPVDNNMAFENIVHTSGQYFEDCPYPWTNILFKRKVYLKEKGSSRGPEKTPSEKPTTGPTETTTTFSKNLTLDPASKAHLENCTSNGDQKTLLRLKREFEDDYILALFAYAAEREPANKAGWLSIIGKNLAHGKPWSSVLRRMEGTTNPTPQPPMSEPLKFSIEKISY